MDRETRKEIEELKEEVAKLKSWSQYACIIIVKVVTKLLAVGVAAVFAGFHLPENIRKWLVSRLSE